MALKREHRVPNDNGNRPAAISENTLQVELY
jgi:hypothetical protein